MKFRIFKHDGGDGYPKGWYVQKRVSFGWQTIIAGSIMDSGASVPSYRTKEEAIKAINPDGSLKDIVEIIE